MLGNAGVYLFFAAAILTTVTLGVVVGALAQLAANRRFSMKSAAFDAVLATAAAFAATLAAVDRDLARGTLRPHESAALAAAAAVVLVRHGLARFARGRPSAPRISGKP